MSRCPSLRVTRELQYWPMQYRAQIATATPRPVTANPSHAIHASAGMKRRRNSPMRGRSEKSNSKASTIGMIVARRLDNDSAVLVRFTRSHVISQYAPKMYQGIRSICQGNIARIFHLAGSNSDRAHLADCAFTTRLSASFHKAFSPGLPLPLAANGGPIRPPFRVAFSCGE